MSNTDHGNKASKQRDVLSYFQKPQSKNPDSLHDSNYFEKSINERVVNTLENASNNHITHDKISSSSEQSEINAIQLEIGNDNVEGFSLGVNTNHSQSRKRNKSQWDIGRQFQSEWASKFPFIEPINIINEKEASR